MSNNAPLNSLRDIGQLLTAEQFVIEALDDIQTTCTHDANGVKKKQAEAQRQEAFGHAIETLRAKFPNPQAFRACISTLMLPSHVNVQSLYHFVALWEEHEAVASVNQDRRQSTAHEIQQILCGKGRGKLLLTSEERTERRHRKHQKNEARIRHAIDLGQHHAEK